MPSQDPDQSQKRVCLGKVAAPHGIKGLVKILPFGDDPKLLETAEAVYTSETGSDTIKIQLKNALGKYILADIDGVNTREGAEAIAKTDLYVSRDTLPEITTPDTFYYEDLIGLDAFDPEGNAVGKVINVDDYGAGPLLEIRPKGEQPYYLPFTNENVPDVQSDKIIINPPEFIE